MLELNYQLSREDALHYYEMILQLAHQTRLPRLLCRIWGPALCVALMIGFKGWTSAIAWLAAVSFSLLWLLVLSPLFFRRLCKTAASRKLSETKAVLSEIHVEENNGIFKVNEVEKIPASYYTAGDVLIISFEDKTNLIIPERAFQQQEALMKQWLTKLVTYFDKQ